MVKSVQVEGEPLDLQKTYTIGSVDYFLKNGGDRYIASGKCRILKDDIMTDNDLLAKYISEYLGGEIPDKYADPCGQGRITFTASGADEENVDAAYDNPATGTAHPAAVLMLVSLAGIISASKRKGCQKY